MNVLENGRLAHILSDALRISADFSTKLIGIERGQIRGDVQRGEDLFGMVVGLEDQKEVNGELGLLDEVADGLDES